MVESVQRNQVDNARGQRQLDKRDRVVFQVVQAVHPQVATLPAALLPPAASTVSSGFGCFSEGIRRGTDLVEFRSISVRRVAAGPLSHYWHKITDKTFTGVYHANAFDLAMMIPYFIVLFILAAYGTAPLRPALRLLRLSQKYSGRCHRR